MALKRVATQASNLDGLHSRLSSLADNCLTDLNAGLDAMSQGDLTIEVQPVTTPLDTAGLQGQELALAETFNSMLSTAQQALVGYNRVREEMRAALGDQSILEALIQRMDSVDANCLTNLQHGLQAVAQGDLTVPVQPKTTAIPKPAGQSIGSLGERFNVILTRLQASLEDYETMRAGTNTMVVDISGTAESLTESAEQMARVADESGRAVGEIAGTIESVAQGSAQQAESVNNTGNAVAQAAEVVTELGAKSQEIGAIVATISGIAAQTNLLALNAAIEAARAGDHGRGFAVVAEEVRKLAEESSASASDIGNIIGDIQSRTSVAVQAMDVARADVQGVVTIAEANAAAAEEVSAATEETSASAQEVAASAQHISQAAESLRSVVGRFTT